MNPAEWLDLHRNGAAKLASAVSLATTVEPELLRAARLELCPGLGIEAESLVWFSPLVMVRSPVGIVFSHQGLQAIWPEVDTTRLTEMWKLTVNYHEGVSPAVKWEEEIVYRSLNGGPNAADTIRELLRNILKTMLVPENRRMAIWAERALPRLPEAVRNDETFALVAQAAFERGGNVAALRGASDGPSWLRDLAQETTIGVRLLGRAIEFSHPPAAESVTAGVPAADPMRLLLSDHPEFTASKGFPRQIVLRANSMVRELVDLLPELYVRPQGGRAFVVKPMQDAGARPSIYLSCYSDGDRALADFLENQLRSDFVLVREQPPWDVAGIANQDVFLYVRASSPLDLSKPRREDAARKECRRIIYALPPRELRYEMNPELTAVDFRDRDHWPAAINELRALLKVGYVKPGPLFDVPPLPATYVPTPQPFDQARQLLLDWKNSWIVLQGEMGSGRSTLAAALARDCEIRRRFPSGILWIYAGSPVDVTGASRLFIFDYSVFNLDFMRYLEDSLVLFTKTLPDRISGTADVQVPRWTDDQMNSLRPRRSSTSSGIPGNPLSLKATASLDFVEAEPEHRSIWFSNPEESLRYALDLDDERGAIIRVLNVFVPDAKIPQSVYKRVADIPPDQLTQMEERGFIRLLADQSLVRPDIKFEDKDTQTANESLLASYEAECDADWPLGPNDGYYFPFLILHMLRAGREAQARELLHDVDWLLAEWTYAGGRWLAADLERFTSGDAALFSVRSLVLDFANEVQRTDLARSLGTPQALARVAFWERGAATHILVAGTGGTPLTEPVVFVAEILGRELARNGYGLISGGWPGVDHVVCREYVKQLRRDEVTAEGRLVHVIPELTRPDFWADPEFAGQGERQFATSPGDASAQSVKRAQAVILIGGMGGTHQIFQLAMYQQKPVFPIGSTGGDSEKALAELPNAPEILRRPIRSRRDAREIVRGLIDLLPPALVPTMADGQMGGAA